MKSNNINTYEIYLGAVRDAFFKLNPLYLIKNPVIFLVWLGTIITLLFTINPDLLGISPEKHPRVFNGLVTATLFLIVWIGNFAEALAQRYNVPLTKNFILTKSEVMVKKLINNSRECITNVPASSLKKGDTIYLVAGDTIPADGKVIAGFAAVDESIITGESAPLLKESGNDVNSWVIGGTKIISDELIIRITVNPGKGLIDRIISLVAGVESSQTTNEITLKILLLFFSVVCLLVVITLPLFIKYLNVLPDSTMASISVTSLIAVLVSLLPTTIGGLFPAVGIASMNRLKRLNIIATSRQAVETCGLANILIVDKTGTITLGNRVAQQFIPINGHSLKEMADVGLASSIADETTEGKSISQLAKSYGGEFNLPSEVETRKGSVEAIKSFLLSRNGEISGELDVVAREICENGGTPWAICSGDDVYGVVDLRDIIKPGIRESLMELRSRGVRTILVTGDNPLTAAVIAEEAGVSELIAEATAKDKVDVIRREQEAGNLVVMMGDGANDAYALTQANVGVAMNIGTPAAKEAADIIDLNSDPTRFIDMMTIGQELLIIPGVLMTFSIANDVATCLAVIPFIFTAANLPDFNFVYSSSNSALLSTLIYNAVIILALIPLALGGVKFKHLNSSELLKRHILIYGLGGLILPLVMIKFIDMLITATGLV